MPTIDCREVVHEISNYIDDDLPPALRAQLDAHFGECSRCAALLSSLRTVIRLYGDERLFPLPEGFSARLNERLSRRISPESSGVSPRDRVGPPRRGAMTARTCWATAIAAGLMFAALLAGRAHDRRLPTLKSQHSQPAIRVPHAMVVVTDEGKNFHVPGCSYIHGKRRLVTIEEAVHEGYVPCVRCEHALLAARRPGPHSVHGTT